jgi:4-carboxymuconolactone decarboxylase
MGPIDPDGKALFERGLAVRKQVLGNEYVDRSLSEADDFSWPLQEYLTIHAWGASWARGKLDLRTRSMLNLAMLTALNRPAELGLHLRGALRTGVTREEIAEIFLHAGVYCGAPAALESFRIAREVFAEVDSGKSE